MRSGLIRAIAVFGVLALVTAACGGGAPPVAATSAPAATAAATAAAATPAPSPAKTGRTPPAVVRAGIVNVDGDAPIIIAKERGYFAAVGINVDLVAFDNQAKMIPAIAAGQLEVGGGPAAASMFNAVAQGIAIKAVGDRGSLTKGHGYATFTVRKDLIDSGAIKDFKDFRGKKIATSGLGTSSHLTIVSTLEKAGLKKGDYELVELPPPLMVTAMTQKAIDAAFLPEPFGTRIASSGAGVIWKRGDEVALGSHIAILIYAGPWTEKNADVAKDFMVAYVRGVRDYIAAFDKGTDKDAIVKIMSAYTKTDAAVYEKLIKVGYDPDGAIDPKQLEAQQDWYFANGFQEKKVDVSKVVDLQFVRHAVSVLGPAR